MNTYTGGLRCRRCGTEYPESAAHHVCLTCAEQGVHVNPSPIYSLDGLSALPTSTTSGLFRYRDLLPVSQPVTLGEGNTPLLRLQSVAVELGLAGLWWKDESRNPTWSYKDRLAAVAVSKAAESGAKTVVVSSTGNHGAAIAAYAARAGIECVVFTLASVPTIMKTLMQSYGATVVAVEKPTDRWTVMKAGCEERGWVPMSGYIDPPAGSNPFGVDGYKTIAYELFEQLGSRPDVVVAPVAYGDGVTGLLRGFDDLLELGLINRLPRVIATEPYGPYAAELGTNRQLTPSTSGTVSFSIAATSTTWQGIDALHRSKGSAIIIPDEPTMLAQAKLAAQEGIYTEATSATTLGGLGPLLASETIGPEEDVVLLGTSTGLKDPQTTAERLPDVPVIEPTLDAFDQATA